MARTPHYETSVNNSANLLRIRLSGDVDAKCMQACVDEVTHLVTSLGKGFRVLTDLSSIQSMDTACVPAVEKLMDLCRDKGAGTVVRVIPKRSRDVGFSILSLFHYPPKVQIITCATPAEAEKALAS